VRVLVGRNGSSRRGDGARVPRGVSQSFRDRAAFQPKPEKDEKLRQAGYPLPKEGKKLARPPDPARARTKTIAKDPGVKSEATALLSELLRHQMEEDGL